MEFNGLAREHKGDILMGALMKTAKILLTLLLVGTAQAGSLRTNDSQQFTSSNPIRNYVKNSGAEKGTANITDADSIVSRNTATTPIIMGDAQFGIDADASGEKACWALDTLQGEIQGNAVGKFIFRGDASLYKAYVYNDTDSALASGELQLTNSAQTQPVELTFIADPSKTYTLCAESTSASAAAFVMDAVSIQRNDGVGSYDVITNWASYTPSNTQGLGTISSVDLQWRQVGDSIQIKGKFTTGTATSSEAQLSLPNSYAVKSGTSAQIAGFLSKPASTTGTNSIIITGGDSFVNFSGGISGGAVNLLTPQGGTTILSSSTIYTIPVLTIPIEGLTGVQVFKVGFPGQEWTAFTPTLSWVSGVSANTAQYQCQNGSLSVTGKVTASGAVTAASLTATLPSGFTIDTSTGEFTDQETDIGQANVLDAGTATYPGRVKYGTTTLVRMYAINASGTYGISNSVTNLVPITIGASDAVFYSYTVPVTAASPCPRTAMPLMKNAVTTSYAGVEKVYSGELNCDASSTFNRGGSGLTAGNRSTTSCGITVESGGYSAQPWSCSVTVKSATVQATSCVCSSATACTVYGPNADYDAYLIILGPN